jgi:hypothetical protein
MFAHQREEAQNGGYSPESVLNYLEIWLRHPSSLYLTFSRGLGIKNIYYTLYIVGFVPKPGGTLGYNIFTVPQLH